MRPMPGYAVGRYTARQWRRRRRGLVLGAVGLVLASGAIWGPTASVVVAVAMVGVAASVRILRQVGADCDQAQMFKLVERDRERWRG